MRAPSCLCPIPTGVSGCPSRPGGGETGPCPEGRGLPCPPAARQDSAGPGVWLPGPSHPRHRKPCRDAWILRPISSLAGLLCSARGCPVLRSLTLCTAFPAALQLLQGRGVLVPSCLGSLSRTLTGVPCPLAGGDAPPRPGMTTGPLLAEGRSAGPNPHKLRTACSVDGRCALDTRLPSIPGRRGRQRCPPAGLGLLDSEVRLMPGLCGHHSPPSWGCLLSQGGRRVGKKHGLHVPLCVLGPPGLRAGGWTELGLNLGCRIQVLRFPISSMEGGVVLAGEGHPLYAPAGPFPGPSGQEATPLRETPSRPRVSFQGGPGCFASPVQPSDLNSGETLGLVSLLPNSILMS